MQRKGQNKEAREENNKGRKSIRPRNQALSATIVVTKEKASANFC
jgi:hypothetical protein